MPNIFCDNCPFEPCFCSKRDTDAECCGDFICPEDREKVYS